MTATPTEYAFPHTASVPKSPGFDLIEGSRRALTRAALAPTAHERYASAHLAALRAAAAVIATVAPEGPRGRVRSAWVVLRETCPPLAEWADFFAAGAQLRAAAEAGIPCVSSRAADDLVREAESFLSRVCEVLELAHQPAVGQQALALRLRAVG
jgi:hypothetical protein